jgi:hypothetical protein
MTKEYKGLESTGTFQEVPREEAKNVIKCKWVYRVKRTATGAPLFKARLVAKGFSQKQGVDYHDTWAPTARQATARALLHLAAAQDLELHAMDVDQAFLHGDLEEELFMDPPPGLTAGAQNSIWKLKRPLYGLKQSPRQWHAKLKGVLLKMGFHCSSTDPSLFLKSTAAEGWVLVYVDDLLILAPHAEALQGIKVQLQEHFPLKDLGPVSTYLGMEVSRDRGRKVLHLHQQKYIKVIQDRFSEYPIKGYATPLAVNHNLRLPTPEDSEEPGQERFPELVGSLMYLMICTRPDLAHALSVLGRFVGPGRHGAAHWRAGLRVLGYVGRTADLQLALGGEQVQLQGFTDASWADDLQDRRSSQGYNFTLGGGAISWKATRSPAVAMSTCEAELYGGASAA